MADLLQRLNELEKSVPITNASAPPLAALTHTVAEMSKGTPATLPVATGGVNYTICAIIFVVIAAIGLYYIKPAFLITRDKKKKKVFNLNLYMTIVCIIAVIVGGVLYCNTPK